MKKKLNYLVVEVQSLVAWTQKIIQIKNDIKHKVKTYIIHKLGGYTDKEYEIPSINTYQHGHRKGFELGVKYLATQLEHIARKNYGCSKQDWIDKIYSKIQEALKGNVK